MKAIVYTKYGPPDVLQLMEVTKPEPKEGQVLVKVQAASANALDYRRFEKISTMDRIMAERFIKSVGKVLGADIAGVVESVGASVKQFQPGDEIFGVSAGSMGGFAEYTCASENSLALKPANISFGAAALFGEWFPGRAPMACTERQAGPGAEWRWKLWCKIDYEARQV